MYTAIVVTYQLQINDFWKRFDAGAPCPGHRFAWHGLALPGWAWRRPVAAGCDENCTGRGAPSARGAVQMQKVMRQPFDPLAN